MDYGESLSKCGIKNRHEDLMKKPKQLGLPGLPLQSKIYRINSDAVINIRNGPIVHCQMDLNKMGLYPVVDTICLVDLVLSKASNWLNLGSKNPTDPELEGKFNRQSP